VMPPENATLSGGFLFHQKRFPMGIGTYVFRAFKLPGIFWLF